MDSIVSTDWLAHALSKEDLRIVDVTYVLAADARDPHAEYLERHIPGATFFNLGTAIDDTSGLPMMLPSPEHFARQIEHLGLGNGSRIILYDNSPYHSAARAWWMFVRVFGVPNVSILDGGLAKWMAEGRATEAGEAVLHPQAFTPRHIKTAVRDKSQMLDTLKSGAEVVIDARSGPRFSGAEADPRPGIARGHIPGSFNLPFGQMFNPDGTWKRGDALRAAFEEAGIDLSQPLVAACGSGLTAASLVFGAHLLGKTDVALYDGSWSEWGLDPETPKSGNQAD
jgi:thiosulfate/3-mercaptopyruvate sulfurtransferase